MSEWPMRCHFRYLRFKTFPMTPRTPQCEVFWALLLNSKHSGVPDDSKSPTFPSVGLHPHTWPKWGCDSNFAFMLLFIVTITCLSLTLLMFYSNIDTTIPTCFVLTLIDSTICTSNVFNPNVFNRLANMELKTNFTFNNQDLKMKLKF